MRTSSADWDLLVIGGGATGLGTAVDGAARGYRTLLVEQSDFAKATSSRSTKLIHGGIRYLRQGDFHLVRESLRERALLLQNAPHLVRPLAFIVPNYAWWERPYYGAGLKLYDLLAGKFRWKMSEHLSRAAVLNHMPALNPDRLRGGIRYFEGQFDDARLAISLAQTLEDLGGVPVNYLRIESLLKENGRVCGAVTRDLETGQTLEVRARVVVNATGVFTETVRRMDDPQARDVIATSQGAHIVLDKSFLPGDSALMVPKTDDGRVLFAIPWHGRTLIGTTDTQVREKSLEPSPSPSEIAFLLGHAGRYLRKKPAEPDILSAFAGLRPLVKASGEQRTARLSRDHTLLVSRSGMVSIAGGKWTTYRQMGEDTVNLAARTAGLPTRRSRTRELHLHGWTNDRDATSHWRVYGTDSGRVQALLQENPEWSKTVHPRLPYFAGEVIWAVRQEMARTVEDVLSRRLRALLFDARASVEMAPQVGALMAEELGRDEQWVKEQVDAFRSLAAAYLPGKR
jgi:glycerol-3-phosphate dehydrogenase